MSQQYAALSALADWQVAPKECDWANYDHPHIEYRKHVTNFLNEIPIKTLKKKSFFSISVNVLCADIDSSKDTLPPAQRDLYLPLEIALTKWSLPLGKIPIEDREILSKTWMINPGKPTRNSVCVSMDHARLNHKIDFKPNDLDNPYISYDLHKVIAEINSILSPDRTVFSQSVRHIRQDLGCLKWLSIQTGGKTRPIKVYGIEDLYVCLIRRLNPQCPVFVGRGLANHRLSTSTNIYDPELMCDYHRALSKTDEGQCSCCASCLSISNSHVLIDDVCEFTSIWVETKPEIETVKQSDKPKSGPEGDQLASQLDKLNI